MGKIKVNYCIIKAQNSIEAGIWVTQIADKGNLGHISGRVKLNNGAGRISGRLWIIAAAARTDKGYNKLEYPAGAASWYYYYS